MTNTKKNKSSDLAFPDFSFPTGEPSEKKPKEEVKKILINTAKSPTQKPQELIQEIAIKDDKQIDDYIKGIISNEPFYESHGEDLNGESIHYFDETFSGVMEMAKEQGNLILGEPIPEHTQEDFVYRVNATDSSKNVSSVGIGSASKKIVLSGKGVMEDRFARQRALSIAVRNAYRHLINSELRVKKFATWYENKYNKKPDSNIIIVGSSVNLNNYIK